MSNAKARHRRRTRRANAAATAAHRALANRAFEWAHFACRIEAARLEGLPQWSATPAKLSIRCTGLKRGTFENICVSGTIRL